MAERIASEVLEALYIQLMSEDLATVQRNETELAEKNMEVLKKVATKVDKAGLFPKRKVAVGFSYKGYNIHEQSLIQIGADPDNKDMSVYLDSEGQLHRLKLLPHWEGEVDTPVDFTALGKGFPSNEDYINFTKPAIRILMNIVRHTNTSLTPITA